MIKPLAFRLELATSANRLCMPRTEPKTSRRRHLLANDGRQIDREVSDEAPGAARVYRSEPELISDVHRNAIGLPCVLQSTAGREQELVVRVDDVITPAVESGARRPVGRLRG